MTKDEILIQSSDVQIGISAVLPPVQEKPNRWKLIRTRACLTLVLIAIGLIVAGEIRGKAKMGGMLYRLSTGVLGTSVDKSSSYTCINRLYNELHVYHHPCTNLHAHFCHSQHAYVSE